MKRGRCSINFENRLFSFFWFLLTMSNPMWRKSIFQQINTGKETRRNWNEKEKNHQKWTHFRGVWMVKGKLSEPILMIMYPTECVCVSSLFYLIKNSTNTYNRLDIEPSDVDTPTNKKYWWKKRTKIVSRDHAIPLVLCSNRPSKYVWEMLKGLNLIFNCGALISKISFPFSWQWSNPCRTLFGRFSSL